MIPLPHRSTWHREADDSVATRLYLRLWTAIKKLNRSAPNGYHKRNDFAS